MIKFFKKSKKTSNFGGILGPLCPNLDKNEFSLKKEPSQFLDIPIIWHRAKKHKKLLSHFWEKRWADQWTDRQTENSDFIGPSIRRVSNNRNVSQLQEC